MNANQSVKSSIEQRLSSINVAEDVRRQVLHDVHIAELIVGAFEWVSGKFKRPRAVGVAKPSLNVLGIAGSDSGESWAPRKMEFLSPDRGEEELALTPPRRCA